MTVYVVQKPKPGPNNITYDISPAEEFGKIKFIFDAYENPSSHPKSAIEKVKEYLSEFDSDKDWIVAAGGDPYGLFLVGYVMGDNCNKLRWLRFEKSKQRPVPGQKVEQKSLGWYVEVKVDG